MGVAEHPDGSCTITPEQRQVHQVFEGAAVLIAAPFSLWLATRDELPDWARLLSAAIGVSTLIVDGGLLLQYARRGAACEVAPT